MHQQNKFRLCINQDLELLVALTMSGCRWLIGLRKAKGVLAAAGWGC